MVESKNILLENFKNRKSVKEGVAYQEALRLVNLYRSLSCFGNEFVEKYNQMLLSTSPAVRRLLNTFMGGEEVEDYLEYLEQNSHLSDQEVEQMTKEEVSNNKGYLPEPEKDIVYGEKSSSQESSVVSQKEWEEMKKQKQFLMEQVQFLLKELAGSSQGGDFSNQKLDSLMASNRFKQVNNPRENYSEIVEETTEVKDHE